MVKERGEVREALIRTKHVVFCCVAIAAPSSGREHCGGPERPAESHCSPHVEALSVTVLRHVGSRTGPYALHRERHYIMLYSVRVSDIASLSALL